MISRAIGVDRERRPTLRTLLSSTYSTPNSRVTSCSFTALPLHTKAELREMTNRSRKRESAVIMSSVRSSAKNSCSGSPLMLTNASTAIDGLLAAARAEAHAGLAAGARGGRHVLVQAHPEHPDRPGQVLDVLTAEISERDAEPVAHLVADRARHADAARRGELLQARGHVHAIAEDVAGPR
jgi:hypothetical protein